MIVEQQIDPAAQLRGALAHRAQADAGGGVRGQPGAVVTGRVTNGHGEPARVWTCAFARGDAGYLVMSSVREKATSDDDKRVRRVIEAIELTQLGDMSARP